MPVRQPRQRRRLLVGHSGLDVSEGVHHQRRRKRGDGHVAPAVAAAAGPKIVHGQQVVQGAVALLFPVGIVVVLLLRSLGCAQVKHSGLQV